jgi:Domain of unknown function (DUF4306)
MNFKLGIQLGLALMIIIFSTLASWYEGSAILDDPWEWKYTAIFSQHLHGQVENENDVLAIDHFVYAAKFNPTFPLLMLLSGTYFLLLIGYFLLRRNNKMFDGLLFLVGVLFLVVSNLISNSPTIGLGIFYNTLLPVGILLIVAALILYFQHFNANKREQIC